MELLTRTHLGLALVGLVKGAVAATPFVLGSTSLHHYSILPSGGGTWQKTASAAAAAAAVVPVSSGCCIIVTWGIVSAQD
jgi:hypothetical protein